MTMFLRKTNQINLLGIDSLAVVLLIGSASLADLQIAYLVKVDFLSENFYAANPMTKKTSTRPRAKRLGFFKLIELLKTAQEQEEGIGETVHHMEFSVRALAKFSNKKLSGALGILGPKGTKVFGSFPDGICVLMLVTARLLCITGLNGGSGTIWI